MAQKKMAKVPDLLDPNTEIPDLTEQTLNLYRLAAIGQLFERDGEVIKRPRHRGQQFRDVRKSRKDGFIFAADRSGIKNATWLVLYEEGYLPQADMDKDENLGIHLYMNRSRRKSSRRSHLQIVPSQAA